VDGTRKRGGSRADRRFRPACATPRRSRGPRREKGLEMRTDVPCGFPRAVRETFWHGPWRRCPPNAVGAVPSGFPCAAPGSSWNARPSACLAAPTASSTLPDRRAKRTVGRAFQNGPRGAHGKPNGTLRTGFQPLSLGGPFRDDAGSTYAKPNGTVRRVTERRPGVRAFHPVSPAAHARFPGSAHARPDRVWSPRMPRAPRDLAGRVEPFAGGSSARRRPLRADRAPDRPTASAERGAHSPEMPPQLARRASRACYGMSMCQRCRCEPARPSGLLATVLGWLGAGGRREPS